MGFLFYPLTVAPAQRLRSRQDLRRSVIADTHRKRILGHLRCEIQHEEESPSGLSSPVMPDEVALHHRLLRHCGIRGNWGNRQAVTGFWQYLHRNACAICVKLNAVLWVQLVSLLIEESKEGIECDPIARLSYSAMYVMIPDLLCRRRRPIRRKLLFRFRPALPARWSRSRLTWT